MLQFTFRDEPAGSLGLNDAATGWLKSAYFPDRLQEAISIVSFERSKRGYRYNPDWYKTATVAAGIGSVEYADLTVDVILHPDSWTDPFGRAVLGLFWPPGIFSSPKLEIAWNQDFNLHWGVTTHEMVHMLEYYDMSAPTWWRDWQHSLHGLASLDSEGKIQDPYLLAVNMMVGDGYPYPATHSYHPGFFPCSVKRASLFSMSAGGTMVLSKVNLYSDGRLEVFDGSGSRVTDLEKSVRESVFEVLKHVSHITRLQYIHAESGAAAELSKNQFMDRLIVFM